MVRRHPGVVHVYDHAVAGQPQVICFHQRIRCHAQAHPAQIIRRHPLAMPLHHLHARQPRQFRPTHDRRLNRQHRPERRPRLRQHLGPKLLQRFTRLHLRVREQHQVQPRPLRQRLFLHSHAQQRRLQLVVRLIRQHGLRPRIGPQRVRPRRRRPHQIRVIRNVGNNLGAHAFQRRAESLVHRPARLHDVTARLFFSFQMLGDRKAQGLRRVNQGILENDGPLVAQQLARRPASVVQPVGKRVRRFGGSLGRLFRQQEKLWGRGKAVRSGGFRFRLRLGRYTRRRRTGRRLGCRSFVSPQLAQPPEIPRPRQAQQA